MGFFSKVKNIFSSKKKEDVVQKSLDIYDKGLSKSRDNFVSKIFALNNKYQKICDDYFDELEEILIMADIGVETVFNLLDRLRKRVAIEKIDNPEELKELLVDELFIIYVGGEIIVNKINFSDKKPTVILFIGVNGVGKTTTIAKLAKQFIASNNKVKMIAGDTFRAGALEQLKEWANKVGASFYAGKDGSDPSSVIYDGLKLSLEDNTDIVMIDTAGRLQNKDNLMKELAKMNKVISSIIPNAPHETLLVIDATTGQNGIAQAEAFKEITNITGIVLTKLDGTAKGGIVMGIKEKVNIPVKYIGLGETADDLQVFDLEKYIYGLFKDVM